MGAANINIPAGGEKTPTKEPPKSTNPGTTSEPTQREERENPEHPDKEIREHTTEPCRIPAIEVQPTKTVNKMKHQEAQKQTKRVT